MNIYVGNLPYSVTDEKLVELFSKFGNVSTARVVQDQFSGRSKGFGFVEMDSSEDGNKAIAELNETELDGRSIVVNEARPREDKGGSGGGGPRRSSGGPGGGNRGGPGGGNRGGFGGGGGRDRDRGDRGDRGGRGNY